MTHARLVACVAPVVLGAVSACSDMGPDPSLLDGPRVLAIRASPRVIPDAGGLVTLEVLAYSATTASWQGCETPWQPADEGATLVCRSGPLLLGTGNPLTVTLPASIDTLYVRVDAGEALPAVLRLTAGEDDRPNPEVTAIRKADDGELPAALVAEEQLTLKAVATNPAGGDLVTTFYTTGGGVDPWRAVAPDGATLTAPTDPGAFDVIAVVRDTAGGVGWRRETLQVSP